MTGKQPAFWVAVAGISLLAPFGMRLLTDKLNIPALTTLDDYITRRNG